MGLFGTPLSYFDEGIAQQAKELLEKNGIKVSRIEYGKAYGQPACMITIYGNKNKAFAILDQAGLR